MSIWSSGRSIGWDELDESADTPNGGEVRAYASGWSNHYPTTDGDVEARACVSTATVPSWCVPGHRDEPEDYEACGPWLRLGVTSAEAKTWWTVDGESPTPEPIHADVVMDEDAVRALISELQQWLDRPKVSPAE